jgi:hypothetical protein
MDDLVERLLYRRNDPGVIMADSRANLTRGKIKNAASIMCLDPGSRRSRNRERSKLMGITSSLSLMPLLKTPMRTQLFYGMGSLIGERKLPARIGRQLGGNGQIECRSFAWSHDLVGVARNAPRNG